jgi:hypothetical protein
MAIPELPRNWGAMSRYAGALRWFAETLWRAFRWRAVGAVATAQAGVILIAVGLGFSVHYFQQLEQDGALRLGDWSRPARDQAILTLVMVGVLLVLLAGAGILFVAQRRIIGMAVDLNHHVRMEIALAYGGELPDAADWSSPRAVSRAVWLLQTRDARRTAIVARNLLRNTVNLGVVAGGLAALLYLDVGMTVLFLGVMAIAMVAHSRTNASSARATRRYEAVAPAVRRNLRALGLSLQSLPQPAPDREELEAALGREAVAEETEAFGDRFGAHIHAEFLGFAIMGVALGVLTTVMGRAALAGTMPWTRVVAYVVVLRITLGGIQALLRAFAFFSRFYPSIHRLHRFLAASNAAASLEPLDQLSLRCSADVLVEHQDDTRPIACGETVEVVLPIPLSRYGLGLLVRLFADDDRSRRRLLGQTAMARPISVPAAGASMASLMGMNGAWDPGSLRDRLGDRAGEIESTIGLDVNTVVSAEAWASLSCEAMARLVIAAAETSGRPLLALDPGVVTRAELDRLRRERPDRTILVCGDATGGRVADLGLVRTLVASVHGELVAAGSPSWIARNLDAVRARYGAPTEGARDGDDEELDDED